ncbi:hypothetical protein [Psychrobacter arcticus]|uniref:hypothetical protein n=1 Tax=Psychrobacter arcticus TaxID=334543 RepID=UPI00164FFC49|nr:hypothetical protein [Psychrobacter arcticus]
MYWITLKFQDGSKSPNFVCTSNLDEKLNEMKSSYDWAGSKKKVIGVDVELAK